jgi:hypothetical protein
MKRYLLFSCILTLLSPLLLSSQTVTGKLVNQNNIGLSGLNLYLYVNSIVYNTLSDSEGTFTFNNVTNVRENIFPAGYSVSENYPNPFNPRTRILITLPDNGMVNVNVVNILGQKVAEEIKKYYSAGTSAIDLDLNGLPNGIYFARVTLNDRFTVVKKLMLLYGSQHLSSVFNDQSSGSALNKSISGQHSTLATKVDSLVVTGSLIGKKVLINFPPITGNSLNLGDLLIVATPAPPTGIQVINGDNRVDLSWAKNHEADLAGYNLYYSTSYNGKYTLIGSSNSNYYLDEGAKNGVLNYYAVTAFNSTGIESDLSKDVAYATPRPEGFNQSIFDYRQFPTTSGYSFSNYAVVSFDSSATDFFFENYNGTFYLDVYTDSDILDAGSTNDIYDIPFAPESGWSVSKDAVAVVGHTYIIWTWDNHYAKIRVKNITNERIVFDWAYQLVPGNIQLKPISGRNHGNYRGPLYRSSIRK